MISKSSNMLSRGFRFWICSFILMIFWCSSHSANRRWPPWADAQFTVSVSATRRTWRLKLQGRQQSPGQGVRQKSRSEKQLKECHSVCLLEDREQHFHIASACLFESDMRWAPSGLSCRPQPFWSSHVRSICLQYQISCKRTLARCIGSILLGHLKNIYEILERWDVVSILIWCTSKPHWFVG